MTRRVFLFALALCLLPLTAHADKNKSADEAHRTQLRAAVTALQSAEKGAAKDAAAQVRFRAAVIALRASQQARRAGDYGKAAKLVAAGKAIAQGKGKTLDQLKKAYPKFLPSSIKKVPADFAKLKDGKWRSKGQLVPDNIMDVTSIVPDNIM